LCQNASGCPDDLFVSADEIKRLNLYLNVLDNLPTGWYEFEVSVVFKLNGNPTIATIYIGLTI